MVKRRAQCRSFLSYFSVFISSGGCAASPDLFFWIETFILLCLGVLEGDNCLLNSENCSGLKGAAFSGGGYH